MARQDVMDLPATAAGQNGREDMIADVMSEGEFDGQMSVLTTESETFDAAVVREALGDLAEGKDDAALQAAWDKAVKAAAGEQDEEEAEQPVTSKPGDPEAQPVKLEGFKLYDDKGVEIADPSKVSFLDVLTGKVKIGYNAMDKEQRKTLRETLRTAANGHWNESKYATAFSERQQAIQRASAAEGKVATYERDRISMFEALQALVNGNVEPIQRMAQALKAANAGQGQQPFAAPQQQAQDDDGDEAGGQQYFYTTIMPQVNELAQSYGAKTDELGQYALYLFQQEGQFLTTDKMEQIIKYELPMILEQNGYSRGEAGKALPQGDGDPRDVKIASMEKDLLALKAAAKNQSNGRLRNGGRKAPPSGNSANTAGVKRTKHEVPEDMKSRDDMLKWLQE